MHFVYHPDHAPKIVPTEEYQKHLDSGWYDTPAKFPENADEREEMEQPAAPRKKGRPPKAKPEVEASSVE